MYVIGLRTRYKAIILGSFVVLYCLSCHNARGVGNDWKLLVIKLRALYQYPIIRLVVWSREVSKPRDLRLILSDRSDIWQAPRQHCCRSTCQISKRCDNLNYQSRGFETSPDLMIRSIIWYWNGANVYSTTRIQIFGRNHLIALQPLCNVSWFVNIMTRFDILFFFVLFCVIFLLYYSFIHSFIHSFSSDCCQEHRHNGEHANTNYQR